jgi:hypothetical protein
LFLLYAKSNYFIDIKGEFYLIFNLLFYLIWINFYKIILKSLILCYDLLEFYVDINGLILYIARALVEVYPKLTVKNNRKLARVIV